MNDVEFENWVEKFLKDPKANFNIECLPFEEPLEDNIEAAAEILGVPLEEYVYYRDGEDKDDPIRTRTKVIVGYVNAKRVQQMLSKKNRYTFDADSVDPKTGQVTGESKVSRVSNLETNALSTIGAEKTLEEFFGPRGDNQDKKRQMYRLLAQNGSFELSELHSEPASNTALNTADTYMIASGLKSDLVTPDYRTIFSIRSQIKQKTK